jgi:hypothetical protein
MWVDDSGRRFVKWDVLLLYEGYEVKKAAEVFLKARRMLRAKHGN